MTRTRYALYRAYSNDAAMFTVMIGRTKFLGKVFRPSQGKYITNCAGVDTRHTSMRAAIAHLLERV